jgi:hypothetical protein
MAGPCRRPDLLIEEIDGEGLVYDLGAHRAHCLDPLALALLRRLDGKWGPRRLAEDLGADEAAVRRTLSALDASGLLSGPRVDHARRRAMRRLAIGAVAAVPAVFSIVAPRVAEAASGVVMCVPPGGCTGAGQCCGTSGSPAGNCNAKGVCGSASGSSGCGNKTCL